MRTERSRGGVAGAKAAIRPSSGAIVAGHFPVDGGGVVSGVSGTEGSGCVGLMAGGTGPWSPANGDSSRSGTMAARIRPAAAPTKPARRTSRRRRPLAVAAETPPSGGGPTRRAADSSAEARTSRSGSLILRPSLRDRRLQGCSRPGRERLDRPFRTAEEPRGLAGGKAVVVAQQQDGALARFQSVEQLAQNETVEHVRSCRRAGARVSASHSPESPLAGCESVCREKQPRVGPLMAPHATPPFVRSSHGFLRDVIGVHSRRDRPREPSDESRPVDQVELGELVVSLADFFPPNRQERAGGAIGSAFSGHHHRPLLWRGRWWPYRMRRPGPWPAART